MRRAERLLGPFKNVKCISTCLFPKQIRHLFTTSEVQMAFVAAIWHKCW